MDHNNNIVRFFIVAAVVSLVVYLANFYDDRGKGAYNLHQNLKLTPDSGKLHVLVTGGAGFIGSHATMLLTEQGHAVTVVDNLSR